MRFPLSHNFTGITSSPTESLKVNLVLMNSADEYGYANVCSMICVIYGCQKRGARLKFCDLMDICLDVATGCAYLERMHFVHR